jgi:NAD(P) transhydrogenase
MNKKKFNLAIIGSGPAGTTAAFQASKLGKNVCIIEKHSDKLGGAWIHRGTLPSKTIRETLETMNDLENHIGKEWFDQVKSNLQAKKLFGRADKVSQQEQDLIKKYIKKNNNIELIRGLGTIENEKTIRVIPAKGSDFTVEADNILIATGSHPNRPNNIAFDGWRIIDSDDILTLEKIPKSILIYGAGVVSCEYACMFSSMGIKVTIIDRKTRILTFLDSEIAKELQKYMEDLGIKFFLGIELTSVSTNSSDQVISCFNNHKFETDVFLYSTGRLSCTQQLGLDKLAIKTNHRGAIKVNKNFQTNVSNIYAAGDAIGAPALASTSSHQGRHVACHAFGNDLGGFPKIYPFGVYTIPELSMVGKTQQQLEEEKIEHVIGRAYFYEIARGHIRGENHGLLKIIVCNKTYKILGIHIVGADACNLIHIGQVIMQKNGHAQDFISMIFNYPTLAEGYRIAAFNALNKIFPDGKILSPTKKKLS